MTVRFDILHAKTLVEMTQYGADAIERFTLVSLIIMQQILLIFWKIPSCTALFHPARLLILGNFKPKPLFLLIKNEKFQPARPYSNLHVY